MVTDRATDIADDAAVIRDLLEARGLLDARLEVYAALEGAREEHATQPSQRRSRAFMSAPTPVHFGQLNVQIEVFPVRDIPDRTLRLTAALAWRILEREAGQR